MRKLLQPLWRPTLLRRVLGALLLAFALVGAALIAQAFLQFKHDMAARPGVQALAEAMATALADVAGTRDAALVVQVRARDSTGSGVTAACWSATSSSAWAPATVVPCLRLPARRRRTTARTGWPMLKAAPGAWCWPSRVSATPPCSAGWAVT